MSDAHKHELMKLLEARKFVRLSWCLIIHHLLYHDTSVYDLPEGYAGLTDETRTRLIVGDFRPADVKLILDLMEKVFKEYAVGEEVEPA